MFQAVIDLENVETGWLHFPTGGAPDIRVVKDGNAMPDRPSDKHRQGFRVHMLLGKQSGGDVREMASNARSTIAGMNALDDQWKAGRGANPGCLPVIKLAGVKAVQSQGKANGQAVTSTNYEPVFEIIKWVPRPAELSSAAIAQLIGGQPPQPQPTATPPQPMQQVAPPPQPMQPAPMPAPQPQLATVEDDF